MSMNESMTLVKHKRVRGNSIKSRKSIREYMKTISSKIDELNNTALTPEPKDLSYQLEDDSNVSF